MADNKTELESFQELRRDLQQIIAALRTELGRMPTQDEVTNFIWAQSDEERQELLDKMKSA